MPVAERRQRWLAALVGLLTLGAVLSPLGSMQADSFPISSYPMFARPRGQPTLYAVSARGRDGGELRLPAEVIGSSEVLQTKVLIQRSVEGGPEAMQALCSGVAGRIAAQPAAYGDPIAVEIVRRRFDPIAYFERGPEPIEQERLLRCQVPQKARRAAARRKPR
jgi:hypothetical protein